MQLNHHFYRQFNFWSYLILLIICTWSFFEIALLSFWGIVNGAVWLLCIVSLAQILLTPAAKKN